MFVGVESVVGRAEEFLQSTNLRVREEADPMTTAAFAGS